MSQHESAHLRGRIAIAAVDSEKWADMLEFLGPVPAHKVSESES